MKHPNPHRFVEEYRLRDHVEVIDEALMILDDAWRDEDMALTVADATVRAALIKAAIFLHQLHLQQTA